jgi:hypothetical protein
MKKTSPRRCVVFKVSIDTDEVGMDPGNITWFVILSSSGMSEKRLLD